MFQSRKLPSSPGAPLTRRGVLLSAGSASLAAIAAFETAHGIDAPRGATPRPPRDYKFINDRDQTDVIHYKALFNGKGTIDIKTFFYRGRNYAEAASNPGLLLIYTIPPGASEGVHTHNLGDEKFGSFDEFYYVISGNGEMQIDGEKVPVRAGDHIFTPNGVAHGIENTSSEGPLRVYLTAVIRT